MKNKTLGILIMCFGIGILLFTFIGIYFVFWDPKAEPLGIGRSISLYFTLIGNFIIGIIHTTLGIMIWKKFQHIE